MKFSKYINLLGLVTLILVSSSCKDSFLDEELTTSYSDDYYQTEEGLNSLAVALYANPRFFFSYEWTYAMTNYGTDEFSVGTDLTNEMWNNYDSRLAPEITNAANSNYTDPYYMWYYLYFGINNANIVIANSDDVITSDETLHDEILGEGYFLRGFDYLRMVEQFGGVPLVLQSTDEVVRFYDRNSVEECMTQIVSDLQKAYDLLSEDEWRGEGTWTKPLAAHMLAKALLFRCSERNDDWNSSYKDADLDEIHTLCEYVYEKRPLATNYADLWDWTGVDCDAENNDEILMDVQYNDDSSTAGRFKNKLFCYFPSTYSWVSYMDRSVAGGLDFQRLRTSEYTCNVFDRVNDSRFWKSFRTKYNINSDDDKTGDDDHNLDTGDLGIIYLINDKDDTRFDSQDMGYKSFTYVDTATNKVVPHAFVNYQNGKWAAQDDGNNYYVPLSKFEDGSRSGLKVYGNRDGVLARTGETYLIDAEAYVRQGNYQKAIELVNVLRKRAEFTDGEDREHHVDGGQAANGGADEDYDAYTNKSSYYESNGIAATTAASDLQIDSYTNLPEEDEDILSELGVSSTYDRMLNFILNERTRELGGELLRWVDLSRTETLVLRAKAFNAETADNIDSHHELRPIPQSIIDGLTQEDGSNLTEAMEEEWQNPGY